MNTRIVRTTTEKLEDVIADQEGLDRTLMTAQHVGGRDWVLFFTQMVTLESITAPRLDPTYWAEGQPGTLPYNLCGAFPENSEPPIPCLYQRGHSGRCHHQPFESAPLPA